MSTKCDDSFGEVLSEPSTICTVYAGPQRRVLVSAGENIWISGMCPPCGDPSLMSASESSHVEKAVGLVWMSLAVEDIALKICGVLCALWRRAEVRA